MLCIFYPTKNIASFSSRKPNEFISKPRLIIEIKIFIVQVKKTCIFNKFPRWLAATVLMDFFFSWISPEIPASGCISSLMAEAGVLWDLSAVSFVLLNDDEGCGLLHRMAGGPQPRLAHHQSSAPAVLTWLLQFWAAWASPTNVVLSCKTFRTLPPPPSAWFKLSELPHEREQHVSQSSLPIG